MFQNLLNCLFPLNGNTVGFIERVTSAYQRALASSQATGRNPQAYHAPAIILLRVVCDCVQQLAKMAYINTFVALPTQNQSDLDSNKRDVMEPGSPDLLPFDSEEVWLFEDGTAEQAFKDEPPLFKDEPPSPSSRAQVATKLLQDLDDMIKKEQENDGNEVYRRKTTREARKEMGEADNRKCAIEE
uniref:Uncharacterized protein n=1 Tax=Timema bartmani TaxID=61472 RepID=A0A7R9I3L2_9NEOP|nr:unnamed protein product [Timema bartmani]